MYEYLLKQGYTHAAEELDKQINSNKRKGGDLDHPDDTIPSIPLATDLPSSSSSSSSSSSVSKKSLIAQLLSTETLVLSSISSDSNRDVYQSSYGSLRSWACNSLESIKAEILSLCFPIFVHCYISLIKRNQEEDASAFWSNWHSDHTDIYADELKQVSLLTNNAQLSKREFINTNSFLKQLLHAKFIVKITPFAYGLLETFLVQNDLILIASIINERIKIVTVSKNSNNYFEPVELEGYIPNPNPVGDPLVPLELGVPGRKLTDSNITTPSTRDDPFYRNCIMYLVRNRMYLNAKKAEASLSSDAAADQETGNALEPSVIFATISNTYDGMTSMHINNDVVQVACGFRDSHVRVWRLDNDKTFGNLEIEGSEEFGLMQDILPKPKNVNNKSTVDGAKKSARSGGIPMLQLRGHSKTVLGVSQDETNRLVLSSSADETIRLWDTAIGNCVGKYTCVSSAWDVSFGPLGYYFLAANQNRTACVYSTDRVNAIRLLTGHVSDVTCCRWHDNASLFVTGSDDKTVRMWDIRTGNCVRLFQGISNISSVACSPQGEMVAAGADNGLVHIWDANSGKIIGLYQGHTRGSTVHSVAFSQDSRAMSSGAADCSVRVWDLTEVTTSQSSSIGYPVYQTNNVYYTKYTPVYYVGYTEKNLLFGGGPVDLSISSQNKGQENSKFQELESLRALNINHSIPAETF